MGTTYGRPSREQPRWPKLSRCSRACISAGAISSTFSISINSFRNQWQRSQPQTGGVEDGIADRRRQPDDRSFAGAGRRNVFVIDEHDFDQWRVNESRHAIAGKVRVENFAILKLNGFE